MKKFSEVFAGIPKICPKRENSRGWRKSGLFGTWRVSTFKLGFCSKYLFTYLNKIILNLKTASVRTIVPVDYERFTMDDAAVAAATAAIAIETQHIDSV